MPNRIIENQYLSFRPGLTNQEVSNGGRLLPSAYFQFGYLSPDENLEEIIEADKQVLAEINLTHEQIAQTIEDLFACDSDEEFRGAPIIPRKYIHSPVCPWDNFCAVSPFDLSPKVTEIVVVNRSKINEFLAFLDSTPEFGLAQFSELVSEDLAMIFSDLHPHLIREHQFFEGHATPYRVDPRRAKHYLNINP